MPKLPDRFLKRFTINRVTIVFGLAVFLLVLVNEAWLHEDAFITLRTVDNFINGYGLRYNVVERVQTFTHPLWLLALVVPYVLTREPLFSTIILSILISVLTLLLLMHTLSPTIKSKLTVLFILLSSRAYVDYSTSGLENPLSHLLLVSFYAVYFIREHSNRSLFYLVLLASLAGTNRLDTLLFYFPSLLLYYFYLRDRKALIAVLLGVTPLLAWTVFSIVYYGFPVPNSAYAKLNTNVASIDLFVQGIYYYKDLLLRDPLTIFVIAASLTLTFIEQNRFRVAAAVGLVFYLLYIFRIGGDYMSGRFFTIPLLCATVLLSQSDWLNALSRRGALSLLGVIIITGFLSANPVLLPIESERRIREERGITDERLFYEPFTELLPNLTGETSLSEHWMARSGIRTRESGESLLFRDGIGLAGYFAGPTVHVVDSLALSDVLMARLPVGNPEYWRIGHFKRVRPDGFKESLLSGKNEISDPNLARLYDVLQGITRDRLLAPRRLVDIWKINTGQYDNLLDPDVYIRQQVRPLRLDLLCKENSIAYVQGEQCAKDVPHQGVLIDFGASQHVTSIEITADANNDYEFIFLEGEREIDRVKSQRSEGARAELVTRQIEVPNEARANGFNLLWIRPVFFGLDPEDSRVIAQIKLIERGYQKPD